MRAIALTRSRCRPRRDQDAAHSQADLHVQAPRPQRARPSSYDNEPHRHHRQRRGAVAEAAQRDGNDSRRACDHDGSRLHPGLQDARQLARKQSRARLQ